MIAIPYVTALTTYLCYGLLFVFGKIRDLFRKIIDCFSSNNLQVRLCLKLFYLLLFLCPFFYICVCVCVNRPFYVTVKCFCGAGLYSNMLRIQGSLYMYVISMCSGISISYLTSYTLELALRTF